MCACLCVHICSFVCVLSAITVVRSFTVVAFFLPLSNYHDDGDDVNVPGPVSVLSANILLLIVKMRHYLSVCVCNCDPFDCLVCMYVHAKILCQWHSCRCLLFTPTPHTALRRIRFLNDCNLGQVL